MTHQSRDFRRIIDEHEAADRTWLSATVEMLDETIRQTLRTQKPTSNAVRTLTRMRDRYARMYERMGAG